MKWRWWGVLAIVAVGGPAWALPPAERPFAGPKEQFDYAYRSYAVDNPRAPGRLTYSKLKELLADPRIDSLDALLAELKRHPTHAKLFSRFTLMHGSQSLFRDDISVRYPRIVFYGDGFTAALTGDPAKSSYETLEIIDYDIEAGEFGFHQLDFVDRRPRFTDRPTTCAGCHGRPARPIWGAYFVWPGAFHGGDTWTRAEAAKFDGFVARLRDPDMRRYTLFLTKAEDFDTEQNFRLGIHLSRLNFNRVFRQLRRSRAFGPYRFAIYGALLRCSEVDMFLPASLRIAHVARLGKTLDAVHEETRRIIDADIARRLELYRRMNDEEFKTISLSSFDHNFARVVANLRYVVEGQSLDTSLSLRDWAISRAPGGYSYNFANGASGLDDLYHGEVAPVVRRELDDALPSCAELREKSLQSLEALSRR